MLIQEKKGYTTQIKDAICDKKHSFQHYSHNSNTSKVPQIFKS